MDFSFKINDTFFSRYETLIKTSVIPYQEAILKDEIKDIEKSHAIENIRLAAEKLETGKCDGEFYGMVFQDSDVAKWLEASAYSLKMFPDEKLKERCNEVIDLISKAQHKDGYFNSYFTVKEPNKRWTNLQEAHELYCAGHMIEAAVAFHESIGDDKLLNIMIKMADHIYDHFITNGTEGFSGHPEIELALMRLYRATGNEKYKELSKHFIDIRGVGNYFKKECETRDWNVWGNNPDDREYTQSQAPVREQTEAVGHAVRAVYLYTGMADLACETSDKSLIDACKTLWNNIINCKMYVTGAIGSAYEGEAFTKNYHLPNDTAYAETCAAIGLIFFADKMFDIEKKSVYTDTIERALYNCVLSGMELDGAKFFYVNQLENIPGISGEARSHPHTRPQRPKWFACSCCPPNVARLLSSIDKYAWKVCDTHVYSNLFIGGELLIDSGKVLLKTEYPYGDTLEYNFIPNDKTMNLTLAIRIPFWSEKISITLNGKTIYCEIKDGYAYITKDFSKKDTISVILDMSPKRVYANTKVADDNKKVAISRGALVYCVEGVDNNGDVLSLSIKSDGEIRVLDYNPDVLCGIVPIEAEGYITKGNDELYSLSRPSKEMATIKLVPYYSWCNRGLNQMRVWIPEE